jgi:ATP-dependent Clp protease ATP-binding subunit ClpB
MTSHGGARPLGQPTQDVAKGTAAVLKELQSAFRPEFLNRIDDIIVFDRLKREDMDLILTIQMKRVARLLKQRELKVNLSEGAATALAEAGFDELYGARPLKRAIQSYLLNPMAKAIMKGGYHPGDTVLVDFDPERDAITFDRIPAPEEGDEQAPTARLNQPADA